MRKDVAGEPYVMCSGAEIVPKYDGGYNDYDSSEHRRLFIADIETGIFGNDDPLYSTRELKPGVVINAPFSRCRTQQYFQVINDLWGYVTAEAKKKNKYTEDEIRALETKATYYTTLMNQSPSDSRATRNYQCILEIVDTWFNKSDKVYFDNFTDYINIIRSSQTTLDTKKREMDKTFNKNKGKNQKIDQQDLADLIESYESYEESYQEWKRKTRTFSVEVTEGDCLDYSKDLVGEIDTVMESLSALEKEAGEFKKSHLYNESIWKIFYENLGILKKEFNKLKVNLQNFERYKNPVVNMASYLICRCGGVIHVIHPGTDFETVKKNLLKNIVITLRHAEKNISMQINQVRENHGIPDGMSVLDMDMKIQESILKKASSSKDTGENADDLVMQLADWLAPISALRIVQKILFSFGEEPETEAYSEVAVPVSKIRFVVESIADVEKSERTLEAAKKAASSIAGAFGRPEVALFFAAMDALQEATEKASYPWEDEIQIEDTQTVRERIEAGAEGVNTAITAGTSFLRLLAGKLGPLASAIELGNDLFGYTWSAITIAENLSFQSYDTISYRIIMEVITYAKIYRYQEMFDVDGNVIMVKTIGVDPQTSHFETLSRLSYEETEIAYCLYGRKEAISDVQTLEDFMRMEVNEND